MRTLTRCLNRVRREEAGQGLVEYALIIAFIAIACIGALTALGGTLAASPAWTVP